eukprot:2538554-Amphidinium_carterae.2
MEERIARSMFSHSGGGGYSPLTLILPLISRRSRASSYLGAISARSDSAKHWHTSGRDPGMSLGQCTTSAPCGRSSRHALSRSPRRQSTAT